MTTTTAPQRPGGRGRREQHGRVVSVKRESSPFDHDAQLFKNHPKMGPTITLEFLLKLHNYVLGRHRAAGRLRERDVEVGGEEGEVFVPIDWEEVPEKMGMFVRWLNEEMEGELSTGELAATAHFRLTFIHPFEDGNGRLARLLLNILLERRAFKPVFIPDELRVDYYRHLKMASKTGNCAEFVKFVCFMQQCADEGDEDAAEGDAHEVGADESGAVDAEWEEMMRWMEMRRMDGR
uniref:Fido domain-containing protein n=1 Tax=Globodera pallida TaxID=36090 RepID=A0A183C2J5_GLOPA